MSMRRNFVSGRHLQTDDIEGRPSKDRRLKPQSARLSERRVGQQPISNYPEKRPHALLPPLREMTACLSVTARLLEISDYSWNSSRYVVARQRTPDVTTDISQLTRDARTLTFWRRI